MSSEQHDLGPYMVAASKELHKHLDALARAACGSPHELAPFKLAVLEAMLAVHLAVADNEVPGDLEGLIALSQQHLGEAARSFAETLREPA